LANLRCRETLNRVNYFDVVGLHGKGASVRALLITVVAVFTLAMTASAQQPDPTKFAPKQRDQLTKCFTDMLTVVKRHQLRDHLMELLYAGCAAERQGYGRSLRPYLKKEYKFDTDSLQQVSIDLMIHTMVQGAQEIYREQEVTFCSGDSCALNSYRKCLINQVPNGVSKRTKPREFEQQAQQKCSTSEIAARGILITDFTNAQKLQLDSQLSEATRKLIDEVIADLRHEIVVQYSEDLRKVDPSRKSCKQPLCGAVPCIVLGGPTEYECAVEAPLPEPEKGTIRLKLVSKRGGEALSNTSWTVLTPGGDVMNESNDVTPEVTLYEGDYVAHARRNGRIYNRNFKVEPNQNGEIEVMTYE